MYAIVFAINIEILNNSLSLLTEAIYTKNVIADKTLTPITTILKTSYKYLKLSDADLQA